jgi:hypothetical protein
MNGECESAAKRMNSPQQPHEVPLRGLDGVSRGRRECAPRFSMHTPRPVILRERTPAAGPRVRTLRATEESSFGRVENGSRRMTGGGDAGRRG